jgi:O-acetyl-ADP-ribose deacetylase (regulator of RNase III)
VKENCDPLNLEDYAPLINLIDPFIYPTPAPQKETEREFLVDELLSFLYSESSDAFYDELSTYERKRLKLYSLLTVRNPKPLPSWFYEKFGGLLQREAIGQISKVENIFPINQTIPDSTFEVAEKCALWKGDITTLGCDAIVNAANKRLLGCFRPFHRCIDNAIHSAAGPMLREDCNTIIDRQGCLEGTGWAKITRAYNLPSKFVLHTVGPIYNKSVTEIPQKQKQELSSCYKSCLDLASQFRSIRTIAFCCISTGAFGFPMETATQIALNTVEDWIENHPDDFDLIIFNVFSKKDYEVYEKKLKGE